MKAPGGFQELPLVGSGETVDGMAKTGLASSQAVYTDAVNPIVGNSIVFARAPQFQDFSLVLAAGLVS